MIHTQLLAEHYYPFAWFRETMSCSMGHKITRAEQSARFRDLVRRGVIDYRTLPHPLNKAQAAEMDRLAALRQAERDARSGEEIPF
jgi:hypothetical protein